MDHCRIEIEFDSSGKATLMFNAQPVIQVFKDCQIYLDKIIWLENEKEMKKEELKEKWTKNRESAYLIVEKQAELEIFVKHKVKIARLKNGHLLLAETICQNDSPRSIIASNGNHFIAYRNCLREA